MCDQPTRQMSFWKCDVQIFYFQRMRLFHYSEIKNQKWDSDILGLIAAIYKEAGKEEIYLKQRPEELEKLVEIANL